MKKLLIIFLMLFLSACAAERVKTPSKCDPGSPKIADLKTWAMETYHVDVKTDRMLLCEIANARGIHLEATGDLIMVADSVAIRANAYPLAAAKLVFLTLRDTFLAAARGQTVISSGDLYDLAFMYAGEYPEIGIVLQYTDILRLPEFKDRVPTALDFMDLVQWCDKNLKMLSR